MRRTIGILLMVTPALASAGSWSGEAGLGLLTSSGNSETRSANAKLALDWSGAGWHNAFLAQAMNAADSGQTTSERYLLGNQLDRDFDERRYAFLAVEFERDLFGGLRQRTSQTVGYGHRFLTGPVHELEAEIGAGARQTEAQQTRAREDDGIARAAGRWKWTLSPTSSFQQQLKTESGASNTFSESVSELKLSVVGNLFLSAAVTVRHNSEVAPAVKSTDTFTALTLSYTFGQTP